MTRQLVLRGVETAATTYRFRGDDGRGWALCTVNDATGEVTISSDWGTWSHVWPTHPDSLGQPTLTAFLGSRADADYLARKLLTGDGERFAPEKTTRAFGRLIAARRLEDGREQIDRRWDDEFPIPPHVAGRYDDQGLPILSDRMPHEYQSGRPHDLYGRPYERLPYLTREAARDLLERVESAAHDCGGSVDLFLERLPHDLYEVVEEPWNEVQHEPTSGARALRDLILPALIAACGARSAMASAPAEVASS